MKNQNNIPIRKVVKLGRHFRYEHLEGRRFIVLIAFNAAISIWNLLSPWPWKLFSIFSVVALVLSIIMLVKANIVTIPDWAKDARDAEH